MYLPKPFEEARPEMLHALIQAHPLGTWVLATDAGVLVNHVPFYAVPADDGGVVLRGHVARANPVWRSVAGACESVVVFQGPDVYISPSWYPSKQVDGKVVPTWNYAVVHARGQAVTLDDADAKREIVTRLTEQHESGRPDPWQVSDAPDDYLTMMLRAIVGIEIRVASLTGKWKNSQNRPAADRASVAAGLGQDAPLLPPQG